MARKESVLITGGASDIGYACRKLLNAQGVQTVCLLNSNSHAAKSLDHEAVYEVDLRETEKVLSTIDLIQESYHISSFISLAGFNIPSSFMDFREELLWHHLLVNAIAPLQIARRLIPSMKESGYGRIALTSSIGVKFGGSDQHFPYSFSKHCGEFIPSEMNKLAADNIFTNVIRVGVTDTRKIRSLGKDLFQRASLIPAKRLAQPAEIAEFLVWISSKKNHYITGQIIGCSGGE